GGGGGTVYGGGAGGSSHTTADVSGVEQSLAALGSTPTITITFAGLMLNVATDGNGTGFVDAPGVASSSPTALDCGRNTPSTHTDCAKEYRPGASVTLTAHPDTATSTFTGFSGGGCSGTEPCVVTMDEARDVTATFTLAPRALDVTAAGTGAGYVDSSPTGLDCGRNLTGHDECGTSFDHGTSVTLTAHPDTTTSTFEGFSGGGCSGTDPCVVTMDQARSVTATFAAVPQATIAVDPSSADLGSVRLGETSAARTFTVTNTSSGITVGPLVLDDAALSGAGFAIADDECSDTTVAPDDTCTFAATFSPSEAGAATGTVTLPSNATGSPTTIALSATGTTPPKMVPEVPWELRPPLVPTAPLEPVRPVVPVAPVPPVGTVTLSNQTVTRCMGSAKGARRNVTVGYTVSAPSRVTFTLQRRVKTTSGVRSKCPKPQAAGTTAGEYVAVPRSAARDARTRAAAPSARALSTTLSVAAGRHTFALKTLLGTTKLTPGRYRVLIQVVSVTGAKTQHKAYFWVLKPGKR
ncbi:MAG: choice-of-anchor D domain-containing protein, partial [Patulibacter sp.]